MASTLDKEAYESISELAEQLPSGWRDLYAELLRTLITYPTTRSAVKRWLRDAGYGDHAQR